MTGGNADLHRLISEWDLVVPVPRGSAPVSRPPAPRLATLAGAAGAFLDNSKDNAAALLAEVGRLLQTEYKAAPPRFFSKPLHTRVALESQIEEAARLEYAVIAIGD
jgi:hypothetical protein